MTRNEREEMKKHCYCKRCGNEIKRNPEKNLMTLYRIINHKLDGKERKDEVQRYANYIDYSIGFYLCKRCAKEFQVFMEFGTPQNESMLIEALRTENEALRSEKLGKIEEVLTILQDEKNYYEKLEKETYGNILGYKSGYNFI